MTDIYLKKGIQLKGIEMLACIEEDRIFGIYLNRTYDFTIKSFDAT